MNKRKFCKKCNKHFSGKGSWLNPYKCGCGIWILNWHNWKFELFKKS